MIENLLTLDGAVLLWIQEFLRHPFFDPIVIFITSLGDAGLIWIVATILLLIPKKTRKAGCISALALLGSLLINNYLIKNLVARPRPFTKLAELTILIPKPGEFSFPSGHTSASFAAATVFYRHLPKKLGVPAMILAVLIGFSRLYVGVHYPTDVLAGAILGTLIGYLAEWIVNFIINKKSEVNKK